MVTIDYRCTVQARTRRDEPPPYRWSLGKSTVGCTLAPTALLYRYLNCNSTQKYYSLWTENRVQGSRRYVDHKFACRFSTDLQTDPLSATSIANETFANKSKMQFTRSRRLHETVVAKHAKCQTRNAMLHIIFFLHKHLLHDRSGHLYATNGDPLCSCLARL